MSRFTPPTGVGLASRPTVPLSAAEIDALVLSGLDAHGQGRLLEAGAFYHRALAARPDHPDALNLAGALAFQEGDTDQAIRLIEKAVKAFPGHKDAHQNLAEALEKTGRIEEAVASLKRALAIQPDEAEVHVKLSRLTLLLGTAALALSHANVAAALDPANAEAYRERGAALRRLMLYEEAAASLYRALELKPDDVKTLSSQGYLLNDLNLGAQAADAFRRALAVEPGHLESLIGLAAALQSRGAASEVIAIHDQAVALHPSDADVRRRRAIALRDSGDFESARAEFAASLEHDPDDAGALYGLARMKRLDDTPAERARLARLASGANPRPGYRVVAGFALGELLDQAGEPDAAFRRFAEANALHARQRAARGERFDAEELRDQVEQTETMLAPAFRRDVHDWGNPIDSPVFIVGLPRSGTTLVEQICASHSQVAGAGELRLIEGAGRRLGEHNAKARTVGEWDAREARARADEVAAEFKAIGGGASRVVDKTPLNLMRLGLIGALLPNARVIWCRRDPRDTVVSLHLTYFARGNLFSTSLTDCAFAVRRIESIGDSYKAHSRLLILEVGYEALIGDLEGNARRIIDHLGLPWEPGVLDFQKTERSVATPSSWQVRQPIYSSSVGRWRRYEKHLGPMLAALER